MIGGNGPQPSSLGVQHAATRKDLLRRLHLGSRQIAKRENCRCELPKFFQRGTFIGLLLPQLSHQETGFMPAVYSTALVIGCIRFEPGNVSFQRSEVFSGFTPDDHVYESSDLLAFASVVVEKLVISERRG